MAFSFSSTRAISQNSSLEDLIYIKEALGKDSSPIKIYKLRTMNRANNSISRQRDNLGKLVANESRVTTLGKFLRRYWIDELPQLYNLLRGDISLVGIRPASEEEWDDFPSEHKKAALMYKPGLFGINYADNNISHPDSTFENIIKTQEEYLKQKQNHPTLTDIKYFFKIIYNILFKGVRSK